MQLKSKAGFTALLAAIALGMLFTPSIFAAKSFWGNDVVEAFTNAKGEDKLLLVQFYSETCPYCIKMEKEVLNEKPVKDLCEKVECVKINATTDIEGRQLARKFRVRGFPYTLIIDKEGNFIGNIMGYRPLDEFVSNVSDSVKKHEGFLKAKDVYKTDKNNVEANYLLAEGYYDRKNYKTALIHADKIIKLDPENKKQFTDQAYILKAFATMYTSNDPEKVISILDTMLSKWPNSKFAKNAMFMKGVVMYENGQQAEAKELFISIKKKYPDDKQLVAYINRLVRS